MFEFLILFLGQSAVCAAPNPPIKFIQNKNQWRRTILFKAEIPQAEILLLQDRVQYLIKKEVTNTGKGNEYKPSGVHEGGPHSHGSCIFSQLYEEHFINANKSLLIEAEDPSGTLYNYFVGNDRSSWASGARGFSAILYHEVYSNIDLKIYSDKDRVKKDWIIQPHGNPDEIELNYDGIESMRLVDGNVTIVTNAGEVTELKPYAYQKIGNKIVSVPCSYRLKGTVLRYELPEGYDPNETLVIDPILIFSGYSGSTYDNWGNSATYDQYGNLYSGGMVTTFDGGFSFPTTVGAYNTVFSGGQWDVAILKYDSSGHNVLYATYLGGNGTESPQSLVVDNSGELLILGATSSNNFPVTNGSTFKGGATVDPLGGTDYIGGSDLFVAKLSEDGSRLVSATYLGGTANDGLNFISGSMLSNQKSESPLARNYGDQLRSDIIIDANNFVYLASNTLSPDFPVINNPDPSANFSGGSHDAVLVKLTPDLSTIVWSRLIGGSGTDAAYSLKLDPTNGIYIGGGTNSPDFEGMNGLNNSLQGDVDGWIAHISAAGDQVINATYLGTPSYDQTYFIDLNSSTEVYAYGQTNGAYPVQGSVYSNPNSGQFLHKLSADLIHTLFSTVVGSGSASPNISPTAFLVSDCNTIYLSGWGGLLNAPDEIYGFGIVHRNYVGGSTLDMPITSNAYQMTSSGNDFYFMVMSSDASKFLYGTYLGGALSLTHVDGGTSRFDKRGVVFHAVCAGCGGHSDFPAVNVSLDHERNLSSNCNNAAFKFDLSLLKARIQTNTVKLNTPGFNKICLGEKVVFQNLSVGGQKFEWNFADGPAVVEQDTSLIVHQYAQPGTFIIKLKAIDEGTCIGKDSTFTTIYVFKPTPEVGGDQVICSGGSAQLEASGGATYNWSTGDGSFTSQEAQPFVTPKDTATYFVTVIDNNGCIKKDTVKISVVPGIDFKFDVSKTYDCFSRPSVHVKNLTDPEEEVFFDFGDGTTSDQSQDTHQFQKDGTYPVRLVGKKEFCVYDKKVDLPVYELKVPNVITPGTSLNLNDNFVIQYGDRPISESTLHVSLSIFNRWGKRVFHSDDYRDDWSAENVEGGVYYYEADVIGETKCKGWLHVIK